MGVGAMLLRWIRGRALEERGQGLVVGALAMVVILGFAGVAVDVGQFMHERRELQKAADAAALAGAQELPQSPGDAQQRALEWAESNGIGDGELEAIEITTTYAANDTIVVEVKRDVPFFFARVLGFSGHTTRVEAAARVGSPGAMVGLAPFGVLEDAIKVDEPTVLRYDAQSVVTGNFGPLAIDGPGADIYGETIRYGSETALCAEIDATCSDPTAQTQTGNMIGPTSAALDWRVTNTPSECDEFDEVFHEVSGTYRLISQCNPFPYAGPDLGSRVVIIPVIDELCNGSCTVTILRFAMFFVDELGHCSGNDCEITGQFVDAQADVGAFLGSYDPDGLFHFVRLVE
jgi:hypothetical protein